MSPKRLVQELMTRKCEDTETKKIGVPIVAQWVKNPTSIHKDVGSIPVLARWVKDLVWLQAEVQVADEARIWCCCCCSCAIGWQLQFQSDP